jgi:hypothetical protein
MLGKRFTARLAALALVAGGLAVVGGTGTAHATETPALSVADVTAAEGNFGTASIRVPVTLSVPSASKIKVPYTISAAPGNTDPRDQYILKGTVTFAIGAVSKYVTVRSPGDTVVEPDQHLQVMLGTPIGGPVTIEKGVGAVTLTDDDANGLPPQTLTVSIGDVTMTEGNEGVRIGYIPVTLSAPATVVTKVGFSIDCNTAELLTDVTIAKHGTIAFQVGEQSKFIAFKIYPDWTPETTRAISESIVAQAKTVVVLDNRGDAQINDDDGTLPAMGGHPVPNFQTESLPSGSSFNAQSVGANEMVDVNPDGSAGATPYSPYPPVLSYDGRYAAFVSPQPGLVAGDTNGARDVFVRDRQTGTTELVSRHEDGSPVTAAEQPWVGSLIDISADGRYVAYGTTVALDPHDTNTSTDIYIYDRSTHTTELVSQDASGNAMGYATFPNSVSAHGRYVLFAAWTGTQNALFVRDRQLGTTTQIYDKAYSNTDNVLSANGRYAVVPAEADGCLAPDLVVIDLTDGSAERVDVTDDGEAAVQDYDIWYWFFKPAISGDGRYVTFNDDAWNLVPGLTQQPAFAGAFDSNTTHMYVRDLVDKSTTMVGLGADGSVPPPIGPSQTAISWDGNIVATEGVYVFDRAAGTSERIGAISPDAPALGPSGQFSYNPTALSGDGRYIGFDLGYHTDPSMSDASYTQHLWIQRLR